jgi:homoserine trans-succinylase
VTRDDLEPQFAGTYHVTDDLDLTGHVRWFASSPALIDTWAEYDLYADD